jgi:hypothetical protein
MRPAACWFALALSGAVAAAEIDFGPVFAVSGAPAPGVYQQLDGPARQHVAVSDDTVGVIWEDNRDGSSQAYFASMRVSGAGFGASRRVSTGRAASEPVVAALGRGRFLAAWEQDGSAWVRLVEAGTLGPPLQLAVNAAHVVLATRANVVYAAWSEQQGQYFRLRIARLTLAPDGDVTVASAGDVERGALAGDQLYPSLALFARGGVIAWEDRRRGHTAIYYSAFDDQQKFRPPQLLNELRAQRSVNFGRGPGAARVALAVCGEACVVAVWLDKRDFLSGYDIYAALSDDGGKRFGKNEKVQDEFGSNISQWHAAVGAGKGHVIAVWDDDRDETADIWLSWREAEGWSADIAVPGASGPAQQSSPAITLDDEGNLHLVWLHRDAEGGPTQIRYLRARRAVAVKPP